LPGQRRSGSGADGIDGADFAGSMSTGAAKLEMLAVGGKRYMKPNEQFWTTITDAKKGKTLAKAVGDRWISGADSDASFADLFTIGSVDGLLKPNGTISKGEEKVIAGVPGSASRMPATPTRSSGSHDRRALPGADRQHRRRHAGIQRSRPASAHPTRC
jgi:hypothetical protein